MVECQVPQNLIKGPDKYLNLKILNKAQSEILESWYKESRPRPSCFLFKSNAIFFCGLLRVFSYLILNCFNFYNYDRFICLHLMFVCRTNLFLAVVLEFIVSISRFLLQIYVRLGN